MNVVPVAATLGLTCPVCGGQLEDRIGPFWCPSCRKPVSSWTLLARMDLTKIDPDRAAPPP